MSGITVNNQHFCMTRAHIGQAPAIYMLVNDAYAKEETRKPHAKRFGSIEEVSSLIQKADSIAWYILQPQDDSEVIGSLQLTKKDGQYSLGAFAINPKYKKLQLGAKMLEGLAHQLSVQKVREVFLDVLCIAKESLKVTDEWQSIKAEIESEPNKLAAFYERNGFKFTGFVELPSIGWQKGRVEKFHNKIFFQQMRKELYL